MGNCHSFKSMLFIRTPTPECPPHIGRGMGRGCRYSHVSQFTRGREVYRPPCHRLFSTMLMSQRRHGDLVKYQGRGWSGEGVVRGILSQPKHAIVLTHMSVGICHDPPPPLPRVGKLFRTGKVAEDRTDPHIIHQVIMIECSQDP